MSAVEHFEARQTASHTQLRSFVERIELEALVDTYEAALGTDHATRAGARS